VNARECWQWDHTVPARLSSVENVVRDLRAFLTGCCSPRFQFDAELLLREALTNAIEHGCCCNPERRVRCVVRRRAQRLLLGVFDDGPGFDWRACQMTEPALEVPRGRGLPILHLYSNAMRFNAAGNGVVVIRREEPCPVVAGRRSWSRCKPM
jgi:anti-sigma regulatory factor (Ser/Thr protein kinase)